MNEPQNKKRRKSSIKKTLVLNNSFEERLSEIERGVKESSALGLIAVGLAVITIGISGLALGSNPVASGILLFLGLLITVFGARNIPRKNKRKKPIKKSLSK